MRAPERKKTVRYRRQEVVLSDPAEGSDGAFLPLANHSQRSSLTRISTPYNTAIFILKIGEPESAQYETMRARNHQRRTDGTNHPFNRGTQAPAAQMHGPGKRLASSIRDIKLLYHPPRRPFLVWQAPTHGPGLPRAQLVDATVPDRPSGVSPKARARATGQQNDVRKVSNVGVSAEPALSRR